MLLVTGYRYTFPFYQLLMMLRHSKILFLLKMLFQIQYHDDNGATPMAFINDTKIMLLDLSTALQVENADDGSYFGDRVLGDVDYGVSTILPLAYLYFSPYRWPMSIRGSPMSVSMKLWD